MKKFIVYWKQKRALNFFSRLQTFELARGRYEILDNNNSLAAFMTVYFDDV